MALEGIMIRTVGAVVNRLRVARYGRMSAHAPTRVPYWSADVSRARLSSTVEPSG